MQYKIFFKRFNNTKVDIPDLSDIDRKVLRNYVRAKVPDVDDEEIAALDAAGISLDVVPGITAASAAASTLKTSLTRRHRNSSLQFLTGRDVDGFADHDWQKLALEGATAAIYMGTRAARFFSGRLLMHGANSETPITVVENVSRSNQRTIASTIGTLVDDVDAADISGPAILLLGLAPHQSVGVIQQISGQNEISVAGGF